MKNPKYVLNSKVLFVLAVFFLAVMFAAQQARAIPAFARKYRMSCTTCHAPVPRLKPYGDDFAGNAFQLEDKEAPREFYDTGDDILLLQRTLPLAVRFDAYAEYNYEDEMDWADFKTPYGMKLMSGGNISKSIGYYFYFYLSEHGEVAGIEDAYLHFNNLFGVDIDVMVGQFQVSDPLFKRELRLTYEDYMIYTTRIGETPTNLTYDRGIMVTYGSPFGTDAVVVLVNGNGKGEEIDGSFDEDDWKNVLLRLSQGIGPVRVGGFAYLCNTIKTVGTRSVENEHSYWGIDGTVDIKDRLQVNAQYLRRRDDNPFFFSSDPIGVDTEGGFVEIVWAVQGEMGRPFVTFLYNFVDSELGRMDYNTETVSFSYLLRRNLRLVAEATYDEDDESVRLVGGFVSAF